MQVNNMAFPTTEQLEQLKRINQEKKNKNDEYYQTVAPLLLDHVKEWCNNKFDVTALPGGVTIFIAKAIQHNMTNAGVKSRSMGTVSYSFDTDLPEGLYKTLAPYKKVKFRALR
ncbi:phage head-tail connector protein [Viridibacillus arvi]|uniref:phage head-tail connector protein n=1 Tax=Viridibacillus arvi TaxID=263475 RepID=UPI0038277CB9